MADSTTYEPTEAELLGGGAIPGGRGPDAPPLRAPGRYRPLSRTAMATRAMILIDRMPEGSDEQRAALSRFNAVFDPPRSCRI